MTPKQILECAWQETFHYEDGTPQYLYLASGLRDTEVAELERNVGHTLPPEIAELVRFSRGFTFMQREVSFTEQFFWGVPDVQALFPKAIALAHLTGNDEWLIEVNAGTGAWGPVYYFDHDPAVLIYACDGLAEFLDAWVEAECCMVKTTGPSRLDVVREACMPIWRGRGLRWADELHTSADETLRSFAATLPPDYLIADLRSRTPGLGVPWSWGYHELRRHPTELLFALRPGWLRRWLRRFRQTQKG